MSDPKRFSTLQALAALAGWSLIANHTADDSWSYVATSYGEAIQLQTLDEIDSFLTPNTGREAVDA